MATAFRFVDVDSDPTAQVGMLQRSLSAPVPPQDDDRFLAAVMAAGGNVGRSVSVDFAKMNNVAAPNNGNGGGAPANPNSNGVSNNNSSTSKPPPSASKPTSNNSGSSSNGINQPVVHGITIPSEADTSLNEELFFPSVSAAAAITLSPSFGPMSSSSSSSLNANADNMYFSKSYMNQNSTWSLPQRKEEMTSLGLPMSATTSDGSSSTSSGRGEYSMRIGSGSNGGNGSQQQQQQQQQQVLSESAEEYQLRAAVAGMQLGGHQQQHRAAATLMYGDPNQMMHVGHPQQAGTIYYAQDGYVPAAAVYHNGATQYLPAQTTIAYGRYAGAQSAGLEMYQQQQVHHHHHHHQNSNSHQSGGNGGGASGRNGGMMATTASLAPVMDQRYYTQNPYAQMPDYQPSNHQQQQQQHQPRMNNGGGMRGGYQKHGGGGGGGSMSHNHMQQQQGGSRRNSGGMHQQQQQMMHQNSNGGTPPSSQMWNGNMSQQQYGQQDEMYGGGQQQRGGNNNSNNGSSSSSNANNNNGTPRSSILEDLRQAMRASNASARHRIVMANPSAPNSFPRPPPNGMFLAPQHPTQSHGGPGGGGMGNAQFMQATTPSNIPYTLADIRGHAVELAQDQFGSRWLQQQLSASSVSAQDKQALFMELLPAAKDLASDTFGNYCVQILLNPTVGTSEQQRALCQNAFQGNMLELSRNTYACRCIQSLVKLFQLGDSVIPVARQDKMLRELEPEILNLVTDSNANHVAQQVIERVRPVERITFVLQAFTGNYVSLAKDPYGCRVCQRVLEHASVEYVEPALEELLAEIDDLVTDSMGNYVVQHIITASGDRYTAQRVRLVDAIKKKLLMFATHKFASNVVEKVLEYGDQPTRREIIGLMLDAQTPSPNGGPPLSLLQVMMSDLFANYVCQRSLAVADRDQLIRLVAIVRGSAHELRRMTYGKHILSACEKAAAAAGIP